MDDEQIDKSEEEKLFGSPRRVDLFDEGDDYYNVIRPTCYIERYQRTSGRVAH